MVAMTLLAAALALQLSDGTTRLDCGLTNGQAPEAGETTRLTITLVSRAQGIESAVVDGPPLFSSTQGLVMFDATYDRRGNIRTRSSQPGRDALRWTGHLAGSRLELRRANSLITLDPDPASAGAWRGTYDLGELELGGMRGQGPAGAISCRAAG
jgi:hypothetical protein